MRNSKKTVWAAVAVVASMALASVAYADTVYRSGRSKGMAMITVEANSGEDIWEVELAVLRGRVLTYRVPPGWFGTMDGPFMRWWTEDSNYCIAAGSSLSGFGIKVTGRGWGTWRTHNGSADFIDQGIIRLKGRL